jgi:hypothetical protein
MRELDLMMDSLAKKKKVSDIPSSGVVSSTTTLL